MHWERCITGCDVRRAMGPPVDRHLGKEAQTEGDMQHEGMLKENWWQTLIKRN